MNHKFSALSLSTALFWILTGCSVPEPAKPDMPTLQKGEENISVEVIEPVPDLVKTFSPVEKKDVFPKSTPVSKKTVVAKSPKEKFDSEELNRYVVRNQTAAVRKILDANPSAFDAIHDENKKLLYVGPAGWRVIDVIEKLRNKKINTNGAIAHIQSAKKPYKNFTYEEIKYLQEYKLPLKVIKAMIKASK